MTHSQGVTHKTIRRDPSEGYNDVLVSAVAPDYVNAEAAAIQANAFDLPAKGYRRCQMPKFMHHDSGE
ncbi:MAG: hypothetical protein WAM79_11460 [Candidatus Sulfotelmatobacter sp.]